MNSSGIPRVIADLVIVLPYNEFDMLEATVRAQWGDLAAIIVEPIAGNMTSILPEAGWLEHIRSLCDEYGIVMIMDEVKTGFRISKGGATEYFGVEGDLMTYAKSIANGFPLAAIGGKREIMQSIEPGRVAQGGTYTGNAVGTAAAAATLEILEKTDALETINQRGKRLMDGLSSVLMEAELEHTLTGVPAMFSFLLGVNQSPREFRDVLAADLDLYERIQGEMRKRGIEYDIDPKEPWFLCETHSDADIDETLFAFRDTLKKMHL